MLRRLTNLRAAIPQAAILWAIAESAAMACPTCKDGLDENYVQAYAFSIIFMMVMPFTILAAFVFYFLTVGRRKKPAPDFSNPLALAGYAQRKAAEGIRTQPPKDLPT